MWHILLNVFYNLFYLLVDHIFPNFLLSDSIFKPVGEAKLKFRFFFHYQELKTSYFQRLV